MKISSLQLSTGGGNCRIPFNSVQPKLKLYRTIHKKDFIMLVATFVRAGYSLQYESPDFMGLSVFSVTK